MARCNIFSAFAAALLAVAVSLAVMEFGSTGERMLQLGVGYVSKTVCSGVFIAHRQVQSIMDRDIDDLPRLLFRPRVDYAKKSVTATFIFGYYSSTAMYHGQYTGCTNIPDMESYHATDALKFENLPKSAAVSNSPVSADTGNDRDAFSRDIDSALQKVIDKEFTAEAYDKSHTRALLVVRQGKIVAEGYATEHVPDILETTGLLGWSMTKSMMAILIGMRIREGHLQLDDVVYEQYTLRSLLNMADLLRIPEAYGMTAVLPHVLFCHRNMTESVENYSGPQFKQVLGVDGWYYSSPIALIISRVFRQSFNSEEAYLRYPHERLFAAIGSKSFVMETDQTGLFVGSSFSYGTAHDWAKLGQLVLNGGEWNGKRLIDKDYVDFLLRPSSASAGIYGGQIWCVSGAPLPENASEYLRYEHVSVNYLSEFVPNDTCYFSGHDGQFVVLFPSAQALVVRLGHTPGMAPPRDPHLWKDWRPAWDIGRFLQSVLRNFNKN